MKHQVNFKAYGESAILIEWPSQISETILSEILVTKEKLVEYYAKQKVYINHAYNSILIDYIHSIDNTSNNIQISLGLASPNGICEVKLSSHMESE